MTRRGGRGGYTLLEFLVAMVMMAILAPGINMALRTAITGMERAEAQAARGQQVRAAFDVLDRDIRYAFLPTSPAAAQATEPSPTTQTTQETASWFVGTDDSNGGYDADGLELITNSGGVTYNEMVANLDVEQLPAPPSTALQVAYSLEQSQTGDTYDLVRRWRSPPSPTGDREDLTQEEVVVSGVSGFNLEYYDPNQEMWTDSWDTTVDTEAGLPTAVRITLTFHDAGGDDVYTTTVPIEGGQEMPSSQTTTAGTGAGGATAPPAASSAFSRLRSIRR
jgi:prepilin-type N-terminal cleavage/methylation domain-containing protein